MGMEGQWGDGEVLIVAQLFSREPHQGSWCFNSCPTPFGPPCVTRLLSSHLQGILAWITIPRFLLLILTSELGFWAHLNIYVCIYWDVWICMHMCVYGGLNHDIQQRPDAVLSCSLPNCVSLGLSLNLELIILARLAGQWAPGSIHLCLRTSAGW